MHPLTDTEVYQETHYYPFGMTMEGEWQNIVNGPENNYLYNGKELNTDFDLNWSDYGARWYDPAIARWNSVDPLAEMFPSQTVYNYTLNNPLKYTDPSGMAPEGLYDWDAHERGEKGVYKNSDGGEISFGDALSIAEQQESDYTTIQSKNVVGVNHLENGGSDVTIDQGAMDDFVKSVNGMGGSDRSLTLVIEIPYINSTEESWKSNAKKYIETLKASLSGNMHLTKALGDFYNSYLDGNSWDEIPNLNLGGIDEAYSKAQRLLYEAGLKVDIQTNKIQILPNQSKCNGFPSMINCHPSNGCGPKEPTKMYFKYRLKDDRA